MPSVIAWLAMSCTDAGLQAKAPPVETLDDKLAVAGEVCTAPAEEVAFPVKLLIVIDQSASLQCTDPDDLRLVALGQAGADLDAIPNVEFGVVGFGAAVARAEFNSDWYSQEVQDALANSNEPATDYQGALATALQVLEQDMVDSGPSEVARSRYVVLFVSDGTPEPRCHAGCDDGDPGEVDELYPVCNYTGKDIPDDYVDMTTQCPDYNQDSQILSKVQDIVSLKTTYGAGDLTFNTVLLFTTAPADYCDDFGYVRDAAGPLMQSMADMGGGTYRDLNLTGSLDFLDYDYESLLAPSALRLFYGRNINTIPGDDGFLMDSDADGLDDTTELSLTLNRLVRDTDGDGFGDLLEVQNEGIGFGPLDPNRPALGCGDRDDRDRDHLLECEEEYLGTDPLLADTDGDRITDDLELLFGTDPLEVDSGEDHDLDGRVTIDELTQGTHPQLHDEASALANRITTAVVAGERQDDGTTCYDFRVEGLTLTTTLQDEDGDPASGTNRILLVADEEPEGLAGANGRFQVACVEARYLGETFKDPPSGVIDDVKSTDFVDMSLFDPDVDCRAATPSVPGGGGTSP